MVAVLDRVCFQCYCIIVITASCSCGGCFRPKIRFGDYMSLNDDSESVEPKLILKRTSKDTSSMDKASSYLVVA